jgi:pyruvate,water dikinase
MRSEYQSTDNYVFWFDGVSPGEWQVIGHKAANLLELRRESIPVPMSFVLTTSAFRLHFAQNRLADRVLSLTNAFSSASPHQRAALSSEIQNLIQGSALPNQIKDGLSRAYVELVSRESSSPSPTVARSSGTFEDSNAASAAGILESFLNVQNVGELHAAVMGCWASLFSERSLSYLLARGGGMLSPAVAVLVQLQISPQKAGVMFTIDPVTKTRAIIIESNWGFGTTVVSGHVTPDRFVLNPATGNIVTTISQKRRAAFSRAGRLLEAELDDHLQRAASLDTREVRQLASVARQIEHHFQEPQDIEWAICDGQIMILQARPITTLGAKQYDTKRRTIHPGSQS